MTLFYQETANIGLLLLFSIFLASIILFSSIRLSAHNPDVEKLSAYECGFDPEVIGSNPVFAKKRLL